MTRAERSAPRKDPQSTTRAQERSAEDAFRHYVLPEVEVLFRVAMTTTRNAADAEDLVQDTLLRAYRGIDRFDGRYPTVVPFVAFALGIATGSEWATWH